MNVQRNRTWYVGLAANSDRSLKKRSKEILKNETTLEQGSPIQKHIQIKDRRGDGITTGDT
jgi:hypothetical protein